MALTYTPKKEALTKCPGFSLPGVDGQTYELSQFAEKKVFVALFICNHCPYVKAIEDRIIDLNKYFATASVQLVGICSNDSDEYPEDSFESLRARWQEKSYGFPYLYDESQEVAKSFGAVCTPDIFVFNSQRELVYRGRFDDSWKDSQKVQKQELKQAIKDVLETDKVNFDEHPSMGCSIKWKA